MTRMLYVLGLAAAVAVAMYVGPGVASTGDLDSWGGLDCNGSSVITPTCAGCDATYAYYVNTGTRTVLCAVYIEEPYQCPTSLGCTQTYYRIACDGECTENEGPPP